MDVKFGPATNPRIHNSMGKRQSVRLIAAGLLSSELTRFHPAKLDWNCVTDGDQQGRIQYYPPTSRSLELFIGSYLVLGAVAGAVANKKAVRT